MAGNMYALILLVIVLLAILNLATLSWVVWLQRLLRQREKAAAAIGHQVKVSRLALGPKWDEMLAQVQESAKQAALESVSDVASIFNQDLATTSLKINQQLEESAKGLIKTELAKYLETFATLRESTNTALGQIQATIDHQREALESNLETETKAQKDKIMDQFETRIGEVVSNYLVESLGSGIDLGSQSQYLFKVLDEHKTELKQEILGVEVAK